MNKILITGGSGFIGRHCINLLEKQNYEIHAISRKIKIPFKGGNIFWYDTDLFDIEKTEGLFKKIRPTLMIHLAWKMETGLKLDSEENEKWLYLSQKLIKFFYRYGGKRILVSGSCFEYELNSDNISNEKTQLISNNSYGISKNKLHQYLKSASKDNGMSYVWARIFFTYGPGQKATSLVPYVINNLMNDKKVETTDGNQVYDYLCVKDIASALILLLESPYIGAVNVSSGKPITLKKLIMQIAEIFEKEYLIEFGVKPRPKNGPQFVVGDNSLLKETTNWKEGNNLNSGLRKLIEFYRQDQI